MTADPEISSSKRPQFDKAQAKSAVTALLSHLAQQKKDALFLDSASRLLLDVTTWKTPSGLHQFYNVLLPHSPHPPLQQLDILLIVHDVKGQEPEHVVGTVQDELRLSSSPIKKIRQIMTFKQFRDEYSTFESKRALAKSVDVVIVEQRLFKMMPHLLGREFYKKKKLHLGIPGRSFEEKDLGEQISYALKKTVFHISLKGQTSTVVIGHDNLTSDQLTENVEKVAKWLRKKFPGGWKNVQKLSLHSGDMGKLPPLVIYFSTGSAEDVKKPPVTKGSAVPDPIEGDVSSQPGSRIRVHPTGEIEVLEDRTLNPEDRKLARDLTDKPLKRKLSRKERQAEAKRKRLSKEEKVKKEEVKSESESEEDEVEGDEEDEQSEDVSDEDVEAESDAEEQEIGDEEASADSDQDEDEDEEDE